MFWIAFCDSRNGKQKEKTEPGISPGNKKRRSWHLVPLKEEACCSHELCSDLSALGGIGYGLEHWTK